jgi:hypothetical protein
MKRLAAAMLLVAGAMLGAPSAAAEPDGPQPGDRCPAPNALTKLPDRTVLTCSGSTWTVYDGPYPSSDTWLSYGPGVTLHGQGLRNPEILSGSWVATPLDPETQCQVEQTTVVAAGEVSAPQTTTGAPGQVLDVEVLPVVFSITLSGDCLWQART